MQARPVRHEYGTVLLIDDEAKVVRSRKKQLVPVPGLTAADAVRAMADLPPNASLDDLGSQGPLVASRAMGSNGPAVYDAKFGRDSLLIAEFLAPSFPQLQVATVRFWAERQGTRVDLATFEQPGAIPHEVRDRSDPQRAVLEAQGMHFPNFGSVDSTPLWCLAVLDCAERDENFLEQTITHETGEIRTLADSLTRALALLSRYSTMNHGFIESEAIAGGNGSFPYWCDSPDAYHHRDGTLAGPPVAAVEVSGYLYDVFERAASLARRHPDLGLDPYGLEQQAAEVRSALLEHFWIEDERGGFFARGIDRGPDGESRALAVRSSNMGHLLVTGILDGDEMRPYREAVVRQLFSPGLYCPAGIRTLAKDELRFGPNAYHNGSVWPHDTHLIAQGLLRHYPQLGAKLLESIDRDCANGYFPELLPGTSTSKPRPNDVVVEVELVNVYGDTIVHGKVMAPEPVQGWAAAAKLGRELSLDRVRADLRAPAGAFQREILAGLPTQSVAS